MKNKIEKFISETRIYYKQMLNLWTDIIDYNDLDIEFINLTFDNITAKLLQLISELEEIKKCLTQSKD